VRPADAGRGRFRGGTASGGRRRVERGHTQGYEEGDEWGYQLFLGAYVGGGLGSSNLILIRTEGATNKKAYTRIHASEGTVKTPRACAVPCGTDIKKRREGLFFLAE